MEITRLYAQTQCVFLDKFNSMVLMNDHAKGDNSTKKNAVNCQLSSLYGLIWYFSLCVM